MSVSPSVRTNALIHYYNYYNKQTDRILPASQALLIRNYRLKAYPRSDELVLYITLSSGSVKAIKMLKMKQKSETHAVSLFPTGNGKQIEEGKKDFY